MRRNLPDISFVVTGRVPMSFRSNPQDSKDILSRKSMSRESKLRDLADGKERLELEREVLGSKLE